MAVDEALLRGDGGPTLRLYRWERPTLSLGWFQAEVPHDLARAGLPVVRRLTGGGAIIHAEELTYSLSGVDGAIPFDGPVDRSYQLVHDALKDALSGILDYSESAPATLRRSEQPFLCYDRATALDLVLGGKKVVGSAKRRVAGRALQHGSIVFRAHPLQPSAGVGEWTHLGPDELGARLASLLAARLGLHQAPGALSASEERQAAEIEAALAVEPLRKS